MGYLRLLLFLLRFGCRIYIRGCGGFREGFVEEYGGFGSLRSGERRVFRVLFRSFSSYRCVCLV